MKSLTVFEHIMELNINMQYHSIYMHIINLVIEITAEAAK